MIRFFSFFFFPVPHLISIPRGSDGESLEQAFPFESPIFIPTQRLRSEYAKWFQPRRHQLTIPKPLFRPYSRFPRFILRKPPFPRLFSFLRSFCSFLDRTEFQRKKNVCMRRSLPAQPKSIRWKSLFALFMYSFLFTYLF